MAADPTRRLDDALSDRYRIEREVGRGGMATVYLADDSRHDRKVAIKVLKPDLAAVIGAERFLEEIRTTAKLQHPHILPLFDSGEADGFLYYVMPYLDGESLRDRLDREKQLPVAEAVDLTVKIAGAIQAAHDRGVIHRDIKPANILLGERGEPLVADFGVALAVSQAGGGRLTETGLSVGTPYYMSPEQASADREPGPRSDVYSLGCLLYEMLGGDPPHTGPTAQAVLAKVLTTKAPPVSETRETVPVHVDHALRTALSRLPADRFESAEAFARALENPEYREVGPTAGDAPAVPASSLRRAHVVAAASIVIALVALLALVTRPGPGPDVGPPSLEVQVDLNPTSSIDVSVLGDVAAPVGGELRGSLQLRRSRGDSTVVLPGARRVGAFSFSPDGEWIAYSIPALFSQQGDEERSGLFKMRLRDGEVLQVSEEDGGQVRWGSDGWIYAVRGTFAQPVVHLDRVPEGGGDWERLLSVEGEEASLSLGGMLPGGTGGERLLITRSEERGHGRVVVFDPESREIAELIPGTGVAYWSRTGHLVRLHDGSVRVAPFDPGTLELGPEELLVNGVEDFALAGTGVLAFTRELAPPAASLAHVFLSPDGSIERLPLEPQVHPDASLSPDGRKLAYLTGGDDGFGLRVLDVVTGVDRAVESDLRIGHFPVWSPDGTEIATGGHTIVNLETGSSRDVHSHLSPSDWTPDGRLLGEDGGAISMVPLDSTFAPDEGEFGVPILDSDWRETGPRLSPDGRWLAYLSDEPAGDRRFEVYLRRWPGLADAQAVSLEDGQEGSIPGGTSLSWGPDARTLYYLRGESLMRATLEADEGAPEVSVTRVTGTPPGSVLKGMHPDGRFLLQVDERPDQTGFATYGAFLRTNVFREIRELMVDGGAG